jgi:hypothetical protein
MPQFAKIAMIAKPVRKSLTTLQLDCKNFDRQAPAVFLDQCIMNFCMVLLARYVSDNFATDSSRRASSSGRRPA